MVHQLYFGDVVAGEAVTQMDVERLGAYRVKTSNGHYVHVLATTGDEAVRWAEAHAAEARAGAVQAPDYATLARELAELRAWAAQQGAALAVPAGAGRLSAEPPETRVARGGELASAFPGVKIHGDGL